MTSHAKARPAVNGTGLQSHRGDGTETDSTVADLAGEVTDGAELVVAAGLLTARDLAAAERLLSLAPPAAAFLLPVARFVVAVARQLVAAQVVPSPLSVVTHALQHDVPIPVRSPLSELSRIAADALVGGCPDWAATQVASNFHRRVIATAGQRIAAAAWADPVELAELVDRETTAARAAAKAVTS